MRRLGNKKLDRVIQKTAAENFKTLLPFYVDMEKKTGQGKVSDHKTILSEY